MRLLYNSGIYLTNAAIRLAALFNPKARLWVRGRKGIFDKLARTVDSEPTSHGSMPLRSANSNRDGR